MLPEPGSGEFRLAAEVPVLEACSRAGQVQGLPRTQVDGAVVVVVGAGRVDELAGVGVGEDGRPLGPLRPTGGVAGRGNGIQMDGAGGRRRN